VIRIAAFALAFLLACSASANHNDVPPATEWQIGPVINGRSSSPGMPQKTGDTFDIPACRKGEVHYVTKKIKGRLTGSMTLTYTIEASPDAVFVAADGGTPGRIALHFQRKGDDWSARGKYAGYRWYSLNRPLIAPGTHTISIPLDLAHWGAVLASGRTQALFDAAKAKPHRLGFTFGGTGNAGHGVCLSSGTARFTVKSFSVG
jgi:hypothetical protein